MFNQFFFFWQDRKVLPRRIYIIFSGVLIALGIFGFLMDFVVTSAQDLPVANGGFETCAAMDSVPSGWTVSRGGDLGVGCSNSTVYPPRSGAWRVYAVRSSYLYQALPLVAGATYKFNVYAQNFGSGGNYNSQLLVSSQAGGGTTYCTASTQATTWTLLTCSYMSTTNATVYLNLIGGPNDPGSRFDDVSIDVVYPISQDTIAPIVSGVGASSVSSNSALISWTTNEPSDTQIEYGLTTTYGSQTTINAALLNNHSQTISNLQADATYNYRVKSRDFAGNLATSSNYTFKTSVSGGGGSGGGAGVINLNQTQITSPIILNQAGTTYVLQNNLTCTGTCFVVAANNIVLDLGGKTATFGTDAGKYRYGVVVPPGFTPNIPTYDLNEIGNNFKGADDFILRNGSLIQGGAGLNNRIFLSDEGCNGIEVYHITGLYQGTDSEGLVTLGGSRINVHDNTVQANLARVSNRHAAKAAISVTGVRGGYIYVRNNTVYGNGQFGINVSSKKSQPVTEVEISGNKMSINGITTNPYQLVVHGFSKKRQGTLIKIFGNRIESPGSVSNRGLLLEGIDSSADGIDGAKIYDNYIDTKEHGNVEYGDAGWTHGFRMRDPDYEIPESKFFNNEFYGNTFKTTAYYVSPTENGDGISVRITLRNKVPDGELPNVFHDNTIIAQTLDSSQVATAIGFEGHMASAGTVFRNNTIVADSRFLGVSWIGGSGVLFDSNTFQKGPNAINPNFVSYANQGASTENIFLNNTFGPGVDFTKVNQTWMGDCCTYNNQRGDRSFWIKWALNLDVKNNVGQSVSGATVEIKDKNGVIAFSGMTDGAGRVSTQLAEYYFRQAPTYPTPAPINQFFNPYAITVSKSGVSKTEKVEVNSVKNLTMILDHSNSPYVCGDINLSGSVTLEDSTAITDYIFSNGVLPAGNVLSDVNGDGRIDIADAAYIVNYLKIGSPAPKCGASSSVSPGLPNLPAGPVARPTPPISSGILPSLSTYLYPGINHAEVKVMQQMLNYLGFTIAPSGPGSAGNETTYYGSLTKSAVSRFQLQKRIIPSLTHRDAGLVGPKTRSALNADYALVVSGGISP